MIIEKVENLSRYKLAEGKLIDFIKNFDASKYTKGRFEIDGDTFFGIGLEYETKSAEDCLWEAHRKYIDVHWILEGEEKVEVVDINQTKVTKAYDAEHDYALFNGVAENVICMEKGQILVLYPNEVHKTSISVKDQNLVKKIVFKIKM